MIFKLMFCVCERWCGAMWCVLFAVVYLCINYSSLKLLAFKQSSRRVQGGYFDGVIIRLAYTPKMLPKDTTSSRRGASIAVLGTKKVKSNTCNGRKGPVGGTDTQHRKWLEV